MAGRRTAPGRDQRQAIAESSRFGQATRDGTDPPDLAGQSNLADGHQLGREWQIMRSGCDRERNAEIRGGFNDANPADRRREHFPIVQACLGAPLEHGEHHRQPGRRPAR